MSGSIGYEKLRGTVLQELSGMIAAKKQGAALPPSKDEEKK